MIAAFFCTGSGFKIFNQVNIMSKSQNLDFELHLQAEQLAQFAREQMSEQKTEFFNDIWQEVGVKDVRKMTIQDARRTLAILSNSEASIEFIKVFYGQAITNGMPSHVLKFILQSDTDGDGRTLAQEIFVDGTNPFRADQAPEGLGVVEDTAPTTQGLQSPSFQGDDIGGGSKPTRMLSSQHPTPNTQHPVLDQQVVQQRYCLENSHDLDLDL